jgi:hypothetical protein
MFKYDSDYTVGDWVIARRKNGALHKDPLWVPQRHPSPPFRERELNAEMQKQGSVGQAGHAVFVFRMLWYAEMTGS